jgi:cell division protein FtsL
VAAAIGTVVVLLALVVVHVLLAQSQLTLDRLTTKVDTAQTNFEQARLQHAQLAAPSRIIARAQQLGLVPPAQPAVPVPVTGPTAAPAKTPVAVAQP